MKTDPFPLMCWSAPVALGECESCVRSILLKRFTRSLTLLACLPDPCRLPAPIRSEISTSLTFREQGDESAVAC